MRIFQVADRIAQTEIYLRLNYDRFDVHVRDEVMRSAVKDYNNGNEAIAQVFDTMIKLGESGSRGPSCSDTWSEPFSLGSVQNRLAPSIDLGSTVDEKTLPLELRPRARSRDDWSSKKRKQKKRDTSSKKRKTSKRGRTSESEESDDSDEDDEDHEDEPKVKDDDLLHHVMHAFLNTIDPMGHDKRILRLDDRAQKVEDSEEGVALTSKMKFRIDYMRIFRRIKLEILCNVIQELYGLEARRIFTILNLYGKLDERVVRCGR